jgi:hypothetical protein
MMLSFLLVAFAISVNIIMERNRSGRRGTHSDKWDLGCAYPQLGWIFCRIALWGASLPDSGNEMRGHADIEAFGL